MNKLVIKFFISELVVENIYNDDENKSCVFKSVLYSGFQDVTSRSLVIFIKIVFHLKILIQNILKIVT